VNDRTIRISGTFPIDDFNEQFEMSLPIEDYHTMGGYVFGRLGRAPEPGDMIEDAGLRLKVLEVEGTRIERLEVEFPPMLEAERHDEASAQAAEG
jgi:CBS domain containing-hemolysin-like protein